MDVALSQLRGDIASGDSAKQVQALCIALQYSASGIDISALGKRVCDEIILAPAGPLTKKLAYDVIRTTRLTAEQWESVCQGVANDLNYHDRDVTAAAAAFLTAIPSWRIGKFILDHNKEITACIVDPNPNLRQAILEALGCLLARDDIILLCSTSGNLLDRVTAWFKQIGQSMLDSFNQVSRAAFEAVGNLFAEFSGQRLSRLAGDKLIPGEASVAVRCQFVMILADLVWIKRDLLMSRAALLPFESMRYAVLPLVFSARARGTGLLEEMRVLAGIHSRPDANQTFASKPKETLAAENILGISDIVSFLAPYLNSLDPALVYEVGINLLALAGVPGGKPEWAAAPITAFLTLWDRQEYGAGREALVRAVASNIQLLDLHLQVALFKRLLLMVRNLRVEADRMHALARVCRTALAVDLFAKESVRRGQKPLPGTDVSSLFEDSKTREELSAVSSGGLFREELVACLVESCFQLSQPLPEASASGNRVLGSLSLATSHEAMGWTHAALGVVEVCRPCVKWDCNGRTYAMDSYLRLLVRLCHLYETSRGVKSAKDGATSEQILAEQRLASLQRQLLLDLKDVATRRMRVRLLWALCEHLNLDGLNPLLADDPTDPVNILVFNLHELLFNVDPGTALVTNRLQDVQALLLCAQHLGARNPRAAGLLIMDLESFRGSSLADTVNKNQCRLVINVLKYIQEKPLSRWTGWVRGTGEYPFGHQKLSVQYNEPASAQDRKLEDLVKTAVQELWRPAPSELALAVTGGRTIRPVSPAKTLSGSSDPCYLEAYHLADVNERKLTLNMKIVNVTELQLPQVDVRVGLDGAVDFLDKSPQAVRQLKDLASQDPVLVDVTATVSKFERCTLNVQLLYYPGGGDPPAMTALDETPLNEYGDILPKSRRSSTISGAVHGRGEPVVLRCKPYRVPLTELLLPAEIAPVDFFRLWPTLPAMADFTCAYEYDPTDKDSQASGVGLPPFMSGLVALAGKPLARVCSHIIRTTQGFQLCYLARTWFGDTLGMVVFGSSEPATVGGFGDDVTVASCRFVFRSSSEHVVAEIKAEAQFWFDDLTDGAVRLLTDKEVEKDAQAKLERAMKPVHLNLPPIKTKQNDDAILSGTGPKGPVTGHAEEQMALQAAVLQEWHVLRAQQVH